MLINNEIDWKIPRAVFWTQVGWLRMETAMPTLFGALLWTTLRASVPIPPDAKCTPVSLCQRKLASSSGAAEASTWIPVTLLLMVPGGLAAQTLQTCS